MGFSVFHSLCKFMNILSNIINFFSKKGGPWISTIVYAIIKASVSEYDQKYVMFSCLSECVLFVCLYNDFMMHNKRLFKSLAQENWQ